MDEVLENFRALDINHGDRRRETRRERRRQQAAADAEEVNEWAAGRTTLELISEICQQMIDETPSSIKEGKEMLNDVFINIRDYVKGDYDKRCENMSELRRSVKKRCFPLEQAKTEGLRYLLKNVFSTRG